VQPRLIGFGAALVLFGAVFVGLAIGGAGRVDRQAAPIGEAAPAQLEEPTSSAVTLLPIAGGVCLAGGAALIGIGMNRWTSQRRRLPEDSQGA
jgi:hypothetical protein